MAHALNIFICTTPRSGSTWFCNLLASTGIAGTPESWYRAQDMARHAKDWGLEAQAGILTYITAAQRAAASPNGTTATRIMWGTLDEMLAAIKAVTPPQAGNDAVLLAQIFGPTRYIRLIRRDLAAQAVSRYRAEQSGQWHVTDAVNAPPAEPAYDFAAIHSFVAEAEAHNAAWQAWLSRNAIPPITVIYEELMDNPVAGIHDLLHQLGLDPCAAKPLAASTRRMADAASQTLIQRYRQDAALA